MYRKITTEINRHFRKRPLTHFPGSERDTCRTDCIESFLVRIGAKYVGLGSSRMVYSLDSDYVIKIAIDIKGQEQNKAEYKLYSTGNPIVNKIAEHSKSGYWIIARKAKSITCQYIHNNYGITKLMFSRAVARTLYGPQVWKSCLTLKRWEDASAMEKKSFEKVKNKPFFKNLRKLSKNKEYITHDIDHINSNYGIVDGEIVLLDGGLTSKISDTWY